MAAYTKASRTEIPHTAFHSFTTRSINLLTRARGFEPSMQSEVHHFWSQTPALPQVNDVFLGCLSQDTRACLGFFIQHFLSFDLTLSIFIIML